MTPDTTSEAVERLAAQHDTSALMADGLNGTADNPNSVRARLVSATLRALAQERDTSAGMWRAATRDLDVARAERDAAKEEAADARSTLSAWFDLSKKAEDAGANVLRDSLNTWLRRAVNGGMSVERANIVRNVVDEAARLYLWDALVPVLRTMCDTLNTENAARAEREACRLIAVERGAWASNDADADNLKDRLESNGRMDMAAEIAAAIRARGETQR